MLCFFILQRAFFLLVISALLGATHLRAQTDEQNPKTKYESEEWLDYRMYNSERTDLPRVLLIGDSISLQYAPGVTDALKGRAYVGHYSGSSGVCLPSFLDGIKWVLRQHEFAVIHFNNGLHGWDCTDDEYRDGLQKLVDCLKENAPHARLVWASTTQQRAAPAPWAQFTPINARILARNKIAADIMAQANIPTDDLYTLMVAHPDMLKDGTHYLDSGVNVIVPQVVRSITDALKK